MRRVRPLILAALALTATLAALPPPAAATSRIGCQPVSFTTHVSTVPASLKGTMCTPRHPKATVLLVHGSTYDETYWHPGPTRYDALGQLARAGLRAVAVSRLGSGASTRLSDETMTADVSADALHAVVRQLRRDPRYRTGSSRLFVVGHSSGSTLAIREAAAYDDVDGLVLTGLFHTPGVGAAVFLTMLHPAADDPKFQGDPQVPAGYVTTIPGVRVLWYDIYGPNADPAVLRHDEAELKDAMPQVDSGGFVDEVFSGRPRSRQVHKPVLVVVGDHDYSHCSPPGCRPNAAAEPGFWPASPDVQVELVPDAGHVLNLHLNAPQTTRLIGRWVNRHVGSSPPR